MQVNRRCDPVCTSMAEVMGCLEVILIGAIAMIKWSAWFFVIGEKGGGCKPAKGRFPGMFFLKVEGNEPLQY